MMITFGKFDAILYEHIPIGMITKTDLSKLLLKAGINYPDGDDNPDRNDYPYAAYYIDNLSYSELSMIRSGQRKIPGIIIDEYFKDTAAVTCARVKKYFSDKIAEKTIIITSGYDLIASFVKAIETDDTISPEQKNALKANSDISTIFDFLSDLLVYVVPKKNQKNYIIFILTPKNGGQKITIKNNVTTVGRSYECDFIINDNKNRIGRKHANLIKRGDKCFVKDLGSKNKTYVNGSAIEPDKEVEINESDEVRFANIAYEFKKELISYDDLDVTITENIDEYT